MLPSTSHIVHNPVTMIFDEQSNEKNNLWNCTKELFRCRQGGEKFDD
jgi:hypothetical protein